MAAGSGEVRPPMRDSYLEMLRAHVDDGGRLSHRNGVDLLEEVERLRKFQALVQIRLGAETSHMLETMIGGT